MVRSPACCEKMGLKKGPWAPEEDQTLISYIQRYGHGNWRALPKQAGLLRCGKSCRLRWINYLRPDIKRGNFSKEEEDTVIELHQVLGNRWSAIAARLPGRTDNEIKNYWHTHLKKRFQQNFTTAAITRTPRKAAMINNANPWEPVNANFIPQKHTISESIRTGHSPIFQHDSSQELLAFMATVEDMNCLNPKNDMQFWFELLMKAGDSGEVLHGSLEQQSG